jgi:hypothetical protein
MLDSIGEDVHDDQRLNHHREYMLVMLYPYDDP